MTPEYPPKHPGPSPIFSFRFVRIFDFVTTTTTTTGFGLLLLRLWLWLGGHRWWVRVMSCVALGVDDGGGLGGEGDALPFGQEWRAAVVA